MGGTSRIVAANAQGSAPAPRRRTIITIRPPNKITPSSVPRR
jgi:hypothetical protein